MAQEFTTTRWDLLDDAQRWQAEDALVANRTCAYCNTPHTTEADVARHYVLYAPDPREIGYCPERIATTPDGRAYAMAHGTNARTRA